VNTTIKNPAISLSKEVRIPLGEIILEGHFTVPENASSLVIFSHGSGSSRLSPRNNYVAGILNKKKIATLLTDLLTQKEDSTYENRFDIDLLKDRLVNVTTWVRSLSGFEKINIGYFGASTGAASAIKASVELKNEIKAIVSRGGRPDLAEDSLAKVLSPTLLIVGSLDQEVLQLNKIAFGMLRCEKKLEIVVGATHLFEEPGKLEETAILAYSWFDKFLNENIK
jgi:dienelactone hydrolase